MPSTPTTKSQVQAYKFVLRRMQSALVRRDAVMLHDPMRTHTRATFVGVCLGAVGLVGFLVWGLISPSPTLPKDDGIVISKESGTIYVLLHNPTRKLVPTFNLASARLLLLAQHQQGAGGQQPQQQQPAAAATKVEATTVVSDKDLQDVPKGRLMGIQDGPQLLPGPDQRVSQDWAVCDAYQLDPNLPDPTHDNKVETTVIAGVHQLGSKLDETKALLVRADNDQTFLVYHLTSGPNVPNTDTAVTSALQLSNVTPRRITTSLLNSIPQVPKLTAPALAGKGGQASSKVRDFTVGTVFKLERAATGETHDDYYVQEQDGIQSVKPTTADLVRFSPGIDGKDILTVDPDETTPVNKVNHIDERAIPATVPTVLETKVYPVACLGWSIEAGQSEGHTSVYVDTVDQGVPLPKDKVPTGYKGVQISSPNADHLRIDWFYMPPGRAAVVRGASAPSNYKTGPIYLVSDRGVKFGVPDGATASALGLDNQLPAPANIVRLLPDGASLNTRSVLQSYDTVPTAGGTYETPDPSAQPAAGQGGGQPGG